MIQITVDLVLIFPTYFWHTIQVVGKPNQVMPKPRLQPLPAFDEPFSRIIIDCVFPFSKKQVWK